RVFFGPSTSSEAPAWSRTSPRPRASARRLRWRCRARSARRSRSKTRNGSPSLGRERRVVRDVVKVPRSSPRPPSRLACLACVAFVAVTLVPGRVAAQEGFTLTARGFAGYTHERPEVLGSEHDVWTAGNPEVSYLVTEPR